VGVKGIQGLNPWTSGGEREKRNQKLSKSEREERGSQETWAGNGEVTTFFSKGDAFKGGKAEEQLKNRTAACWCHEKGGVQKGSSKYQDAINFALGKRWPGEKQT